MNVATNKETGETIYLGIAGGIAHVSFLAWGGGKAPTNVTGSNQPRRRNGNQRAGNHARRRNA